MIKKNYISFSKESQSLIRHCWTYDIYKKNLSRTSYKEKFVNFLTKDGKKLKAYNIFNRTGLFLRKKLKQTDKNIVIVKTPLFSKKEKNSFKKLKILFFKKIRIFKKKKNSIIQSKKTKINKGGLPNELLNFSFKESTLIQKSILENLAYTNINQNQFTKENEQNLRKLTTGNNKKNDKFFEKKTKTGKRKKKVYKIEKKNISSFNQLVAEAINNVKPNLEVRKVRIGRTTYLVPAIIPKKRQQTLAIKWIVESARSKKRGIGNTKYGSFIENLANELIEAFLKQGQARQKRDNLHKLVETNRAYTRYRWW